LPENKFCGQCGAQLIIPNSATGDGSVNITGSNNISNSTLHVGHVYHGKSDEDTAYIDRTYIKPLTISGSPIRTSWLITSGIIGFFGSIASIYSVLGGYWHFIFIITLGISLFAYMHGVRLKKTRFSRFKWFNLESNKEGDVFLTKVGGECPKCDGTLRLVDIEITQDRDKTFVQCTRNSDHVWRFDPTILD
jgi:ribosomal protein S27AE